VIPKILHFCFGLSPNGGDWGLVHYACIKSAVERIKPEQALLYFEHRPRGPFWDLTTKFVECIQIIAPRTIFGNPLNHYAHRADVLRLQKLIETGGIYLDCDVFVHRGFDDLLENSVVLGQEGDTELVGLCNAVILAEPNAPFLTRWYSKYKNFRSGGADPFWNEHSAKLPRQLAAAHPEELTILGPRAFFWPHWDHEGLRRLFASSNPIPSSGVYANHLWESRAWSEYLRNLTPARVRRIDSNFHHWLRPLIVDLPDDLGAPSFAARTTDVLLKERPRGWLGARIRQISNPLRDRYAFIDRSLRLRHDLIGRGHRIMATLETKQPDSAYNLISNKYRRRIFQAIYRRHLWGGDGKSLFFSGIGSRGEHAKLYVKAMIPLLAQHGMTSKAEIVIVDLGCGDFAVGRALLKTLNGVRYIGCDIVPELIDYNQTRYGTAQYGPGNVEFRTVDIVRDPLPDGDVCLVRQVLQHLSNREISFILPKLSKYKYVYISEGQPLIREGPPNPDKPVGADVRFDWRTGRGRGVELDLPPWNLRLQEIMRTTSPDDRNEVYTCRILSSRSGPVNTGRDYALGAGRCSTTTPTRMPPKRNAPASSPKPSTPLSPLPSRPLAGPRTASQSTASVPTA
jgi:Methyltransferase domain/Glycosyltransferase sugar-binding region containing DXD motif